MNRNRWVTFLLIAVMAILILIGIISSISQLLIPIIVLGTIFLLFKFPPNRWKFKSRPKYKPGRLAREREEAARKAARRRELKFRVIEGNKKNDSPQDDEPPRYH